MDTSPSMAPKTTWHGFDRYDYIMDDATGAVKPATQGATGRRCIVVVPKKPRPAIRGLGGPATGTIGPRPR